MVEVLIETEGLTKFFGRIAALDGVDLRCVEGITAVLGPNGAGKTTLIRVLLGLIRPSGGFARVFGLDCWSESREIRGRVGVLHENPSFPGRFTAERFLMLVCRFYRIADGRRRVREALEEVELWDHRDRPIGEFSAGMRQRLGLAQAVIGGPELAILDEPTSNLDPLSRSHILEMIARMRGEEGISFLILSHDLYYMEKVCTHAVFMDCGRVLKAGPLGELMGEVEGEEVALICEGREVAGMIAGLPSVVRAERNVNMVTCVVRDYRRFQEELFRLALSEGITIREMRVKRLNLERLYAHVIGRRGRDEGVEESGGEE